MGKGKRLKNKRKQKRSGKGILSDFSVHLTENFQRELKDSELWDQMVEEFGEKRAEEILRECKAEIKPSGLVDGSGNRTKDIS